jgi:hypothetical protein
MNHSRAAAHEWLGISSSARPTNKAKSTIIANLFIAISLTSLLKSAERLSLLLPR